MSSVGIGMEFSTGKREGTGVEGVSSRGAIILIEGRVERSRRGWFVSRQAAEPGTGSGRGPTQGCTPTTGGAAAPHPAWRGCCCGAGGG